LSTVDRVPAAVRYLYILGRSTLGGQVISPHLKRTPALGPSSGAFDGR
jgi:hypothetical protein